METYLIKKSKEVLREWFSGGCYDGNIKFTPNRDCGVWLNYPIINNLDYNTVDNNFDELFPNPHTGEYCKEYIYSYGECASLGFFPKRIVDVVLTHKGTPKYFIQVYNKYPTDLKKIDDLYRMGVTNLIEVDANWIMKQKEKPKELEFKQLIE